ncbi:MAG: thiol-disulfide oxidoreductase DCC family protein [Opitutaceae bacterium]
MFPAPDPVVLYDGECGLCNRVIRVLMRWDRAGRMRYSPLQREPAKGFLARHGLPEDELSTVYFVPDWGRQDRKDFRSHSDAVAAALRVCGGIAGIVGAMLTWVPRPVRDAGYAAVGHARYRMFGPWRDRPLPRPEWRSRIIL